MHDTSPLKSKKFIAYMFADIGWKVVIILMLSIIHKGLATTNGELNAILASMTTLTLSVVIVAGFVQTGYIIGQAALDKYVRVAEIASSKVKPPTPGGDSEA